MHPQSSHSTPAVTWADLAHIFDTHGIAPVTKKTTHGVLAEVYRAWVRAEGLDPSRRYVMPVHLLPGHVRQYLRAADAKWRDGPGLRALIIDELNDPACALQIVPRPFRGSRVA